MQNRSYNFYSDQSNLILVGNYSTPSQLLYNSLEKTSNFYKTFIPRELIRPMFLKNKHQSLSSLTNKNRKTLQPIHLVFFHGPLEHHDLYKNIPPILQTLTPYSHSLIISFVDLAGNGLSSGTRGSSFSIQKYCSDFFYFIKQVGNLNTFNNLINPQESQIPIYIVTQSFASNILLHLCLELGHLLEKTFPIKGIVSINPFIFLKKNIFKLLSFFNSSTSSDFEDLSLQRDNIQFIFDKIRNLNIIKQSTTLLESVIRHLYFPVTPFTKSYNLKNPYSNPAFEFSFLTQILYSSQILRGQTPLLNDLNLPSLILLSKSDPLQSSTKWQTLAEVEKKSKNISTNLKIQFLNTTSHLPLLENNSIHYWKKIVEWIISI